MSEDVSGHEHMRQAWKELMTEDTTDYTKLSGAEFQTAVGADAEKWARAFLQVHGYGDDHPIAHTLSGWMRDAMDAARKQQRQLDRIGQGE